MRFPPRITRFGALGALAVSLVLGTPTAATAATPAPAPASASAAATFAVGDICYSNLPSQAHDTLALIEAGGPFPYPQDGQVFYNREGVLPSQPTGYYHEYTVETPGSSDRGARRIVTGQGYHEDYYTADHYATFDLIDYTC